LRCSSKSGEAIIEEEETVEMKTSHEHSVSLSANVAELISLEQTYGAHTYNPLPLVAAQANGVWITDVNGDRYLDCISAYSAVNQGHAHPRILSAMTEQAQRMSLTSRAMYNDVLPRFLQRLTSVTGFDVALPMNTGAEATETAVKLVRRYGYRHKGIADGLAEIIVCENAFHGRTTTAVAMSNDEEYRRDFGPFPAGFVHVPHGDLAALEAAITPNTAGFIIEPIQGEGGVNVAPDGFLRVAADLCRKHRVLFVADEIQTGFGRTGAFFACDHENVHADVLIVGKALGGGIYPVSAVLASKELMDLFGPGSHGSTFGGNALASAIGMAALDVLIDENLAERSRERGEQLMESLRALNAPQIREVRGKGLLVGVELTIPARAIAEAMLEERIITKDTHGTVLRIAPPLVISSEEIATIAPALQRVFARLG
jgi:ornithine--oxo-acid transaminase